MINLIFCGPDQDGKSFTNGGLFMYKKCTAAAVAVSVIASFAPQMAFAAGEDVQENYSVSGYISVESGKFLAGTDRSTTIYVDSERL